MKEIDALQSKLVEQLTAIDQLNVDKKRLIEEKTQLQNKLDQYLQVAGQRAFVPEPVTMPTDPAKAAPAVRALDLAGVIQEVKLNDSLVSISIGSAAGVKDGMRFHVIRDNKFICDIVIFSTNADQSSGFFELASENKPRPGDIVKTNF